MQAPQRKQYLSIAGVCAGLLFVLALLVFWGCFGQDAQSLFNVLWIGSTLCLLFIWFLSESNKLKGLLFIGFLALLLLNEIHEQNTGFPFRVAYAEEPRTFIFSLCLESLVALVYAAYLWTSQTAVEPDSGSADQSEPKS